MSSVIMIAGLKRSGKDTLGLMLKEELELQGKSVELLSFADPMKTILAVTLGITREQLDNRKNDPAFPHRGYLQRLGTEAIKPIFGDNIWTTLLRGKVVTSEADICIVPDFRFPEEYTEWVVKPVTIKVEREEVKPDKGFLHISEKALDGFEFMYTIENDGTLEELRSIAQALIKDLNGKI